MTGQAIDDAITHWLADLRARTSAEYTHIAARHLIINIAEFLPPEVANRVAAVLGK
jgi:hypothetical protein